MAREFSRADRVAQQVQKEAAQILQRDLKDPRIGMVTISEVEVSRDLAYAKIFISSLLQDEEKAKSSVNQLNELAPYIRSLLAKRLRMRHVPSVKFVLDTSLNEGIRMSELVDKAVKSDKQKSEQFHSDEEQAAQDERQDKE
ncbi:ribosome-binding factor A, role in processing of 16S rRNA [Catenovulum agarivorans DS-2]|uniref:Ribosome-binding factor A n=1 Tax=Catenovulum agarivorans DS-2 TaxID=1328313 RepID=W7Q6X2_9ALTE|nr:30S ribosome-binding factor RbfA [Catenovulum agarivorans]EWH08529.1 ribosome-binding factor A, role in processing of 16S rRNA [Catenovulum agarivorans DS-2]